MEKKRITAFVVAGAVLIIAGIIFLNVFINKEELSDICKSGVMLVTGIVLLLLSKLPENKGDKQKEDEEKE